MSQLDDDRKVKKQRKGNQTGDNEGKKEERGIQKVSFHLSTEYILIFSLYCRKTSSDKARADAAAVWPSQLTK
jgi:hypothetical protein